MRAILTGGVCVGAVLLAAACGSGPGRPDGAAARSSPAASAPAPAVPSLSHGQERRECASLNIILMGYGTYASEVQSVAIQYGVSQDVARQIIAAVIRDYCPADAAVIPPGETTKR
jgi:hypothetical protein